MNFCRSCGTYNQFYDKNFSSENTHWHRYHMNLAYPSGQATDSLSFSRCPDSHVPIFPNIWDVGQCAAPMAERPWRSAHQLIARPSHVRPSAAVLRGPSSVLETRLCHAVLHPLLPQRWAPVAGNSSCAHNSSGVPFSRQGICSVNNGND